MCMVFVQQRLFVFKAKLLSWPQQLGPLRTTLSIESDTNNHKPMPNKTELRNPIFSEKQSMNSLRICNDQIPFRSSPISINQPRFQNPPPKFVARRSVWGTVTRCSSGGKRTFLTLEEAGLVEISGLSTHEKFLCRLTISSLNLLRVIAEQEGKAMEELNAGDLCDWFLKDKLKREQDVESAVLQWDDSEMLL